MKIRSITCFSNFQAAQGYDAIDRLGEFAQKCVSAVSARGYETQSTRYATQPFPGYLDLNRADVAVDQVQQLELRTNAAGFLYLSIGPASGENPIGISFIPEILAKTQNLFATCHVTTHTQALSTQAIQQCAKTILENAFGGEHGFNNLRFAVLANVAPHAPFFPAAYHDEGSPACGLAMECADVVQRNLLETNSLETARRRILAELETTAQELSGAISPLCSEYGVRWLGFDFSPAPFPTDWCSLAAAIERLGGMLGKHGALAGAAWIADMLDAGQWLRCGFNGLMLPVLEDSRMALRTSGGQMTTKDLLLYSAVCGTGLDTVPLAGDVTHDQICGLLMDLSALALRLNKPLTARLMPIPGLAAGDKTQFNFAYFDNGEVMNLDSSAAGGMLMTESTIPLKPRQGVSSG